MTTKIKFAKVRPDAIIPTREPGNAGYDIYANFEGESIIIPSLSTKLIPSGIAYIIDDNYYFQIEERGSTGSKGMKKSAGVLDSSFTGEVFVAITNSNTKPILITKETSQTALETLSDDYIVYPYSKAIAQLILHEVIDTEVSECSYEEVKARKTSRGNGCLGSSGK